MEACVLVSSQDGQPMDMEALVLVVLTAFVAAIVAGLLAAPGRLGRQVAARLRAIDEGALCPACNGFDLVAFSLRTTADALHFGLSHSTHLTFNGADREANCVEYAELFGTIMNREHGSQDIRAWVVRSDARILGKTIPNPAWKDHDWVLVVVRTPDGSRRLCLDPTLFDLGMGWDISSAVRGELNMTHEK
jgi:hypothetical protein